MADLKRVYTAPNEEIALHELGVFEEKWTKDPKIAESWKRHWATLCTYFKYPQEYQKHCQGAPLPTDDMELANEVLGDLIDELNRLVIAYEAPAVATLKSAPEINAVRGRLELRIANYHEEIYA